MRNAGRVTGTRFALQKIMLAPMPPRAIALTESQPSALPRMVERVLGSLLELAVHAIEDLRDRVVGSATR
jgi:hypothetical protein